jgi:hypothetical protein
MGVFHRKMSGLHMKMGVFDGKMSNFDRKMSVFDGKMRQMRGYKPKKKNNNKKKKKKKKKKLQVGPKPPFTHSILPRFRRSDHSK